MGTQNGGLESLLKNPLEQALHQILIDYKVQKTEKGLTISTSDVIDIKYDGQRVRIGNGVDLTDLVLENSENGVIIKRVDINEHFEEVETPIGQIDGKITDVKFNAIRIGDYKIGMQTEINIELGDGNAEH